MSDLQSSATISIFRATADAEKKCAICPEPIKKGDLMWQICSNGRLRYVHVPGCVQKVLQTVIDVRDRKGTSNDL